MNVYVVERGEYSDHYIMAVFSSAERAASYVTEMEKTGMTHFSVHERELDDPDGEKAYLFHQACIHLMTGTVHEDEGYTLERSPWDRCASATDETYAIGRSPFSMEHARQLAEEARQKWIHSQPIRPELLHHFATGEPAPEGL